MEGRPDWGAVLRRRRETAATKRATHGLLSPNQIEYAEDRPVHASGYILTLVSHTQDSSLCVLRKGLRILAQKCFATTYFLQFELFENATLMGWHLLDGSSECTVFWRRAVCLHALLEDQIGPETGLIMWRRPKCAVVAPYLYTWPVLGNRERITGFALIAAHEGCRWGSRRLHGFAPAECGPNQLLRRLAVIDPAALALHASKTGTTRRFRPSNCWETNPQDAQLPKTTTIDCGSAARGINLGILEHTTTPQAVLPKLPSSGCGQART